MAERVLTERELNRALRARQFLLERSPVRFRPTWDSTLLVHGRRTGGARGDVDAEAERLAAFHA